MLSLDGLPDEVMISTSCIVGCGKTRKRRYASAFPANLAGHKVDSRAKGKYREKNEESNQIYLVVSVYGKILDLGNIVATRLFSDILLCLAEGDN